MPDDSTPDPPADESGTPPETPTPPAAPKEELGEAGQNALKAERKARSDAEKTAKKLQAELDELRAGQMSEQEKLVAEARKEGAKEASEAAMRKLFAAEVRAASAGKLADPTMLADPTVAMHFLDMQDLPVTRDGDIDTEAISAAIATLVETKPFLAPSKGPGSGDGGPRGTGATPGQLTRADLDRMSPAEIAQAEAEGRFNDILGITAAQS